MSSASLCVLYPTIVLDHIVQVVSGEPPAENFSNDYSATLQCSDGKHNSRALRKTL